MVFNKGKSEKPGRAGEMTSEGDVSGDGGKGDGRADDCREFAGFMLITYIHGTFPYAIQ